MMMALSMLATLALTGPPQPQATADPPGVCWIASVRKDGEGVRVHFPKVGGPGLVIHRGTIWRPADQSDERPSVVAALGEVLRPENSHHDNCTVTVMRRDGIIGVEAAARVHMPGMPIVSRTEFIPAR